MSGALAAAALAAGMALLYFGAEWLVRGAVGLGRALGVRPLLLGLTVVAYGTSMPELVVSAAAALEGRSALALGNVIGSNVANLGLILGVSALLSPLKVDGALVYREVPVLLGAALCLPLLLADGLVSRVEAGLLLLGAVTFTTLVTRGLPPGEPAVDVAESEAEAEALGAPGGGGVAWLSLVALVGLALLLVGGKLFVDGAAGGARALGMSERVIGLTIVAVGTSAPELATSIAATVRGHADIAVGNVIGSNIFNVLFVLGGAGAIHPIEADAGGLVVDLVAMFGFTLLGAFFLRGDRKVSRAEGAALFGGYALFLALLALGP